MHILWVTPSENTFNVEAGYGAACSIIYVEYTGVVPPRACVLRKELKNNISLKLPVVLLLREGISHGKCRGTTGKGDNEDKFACPLGKGVLDPPMT